MAEAQSSSVISSDDGKLVSANSTNANLFCEEYATVSRLPKDKVVADRDVTLEVRRALCSPYPVLGMILLNCIVILILILGSELYHDTDT